MRIFRESRLAVFWLVVAGGALGLAPAGCGGHQGAGVGADGGDLSDADQIADGAPPHPDGTVRPDAASLPDAFVRPPGDAFVLPDSSADAFVHPPAAFGPAMVVNGLAMSSGMNGLGPFAGIINSSLDDAVAQGALILLLEFLDLDDQTGPIDDPDVTVVIYRGQDADGNPSNNFSGTGQFLAEQGTATVVPGVSITNGQVLIPAGSFEYLSVSIPGFGDLVIIDPEIQFTVQPGFSGLTAGHVDGAVPSRFLDQIPNQVGSGNPAGSLLDFLATSAFEQQPDVDVDGDGQLEEFFDSAPSHPGYDELISYCVDYFGLFEDDDCPQFPEIWDGYSVSLGFTAVPASIVGSF